MLEKQREDKNGGGLQLRWVAAGCLAVEISKTAG